MNEPVERYYPDYYGDMRYLKDGDWVEYADYEKLEADYARLKAEVERLRKAGDDLCTTMDANGIHDNGDFEMHEKAIAQWNAAKEGNQS